LKFISFNVNGVRACVKKTLIEDLKAEDADFVCLQETKATPEQVKEALAPLTEYEVVASGAEKKGYSGTAILSKYPLKSVCFGIGIEKHDQEGRVITVELEDFFLVNVYVPNSANGLKRLPYRTQEWDVDFCAYLQRLDQDKPVILCGDLNVAHQAIDLKNPKANYNKYPGFTQAEIDGLDRYLASGFIDSFRYFHPDEVKYSWWSYRATARQRNVGWRIDYFLLSSRLIPRVSKAEIHNEIFGSDHCPVSLTLTE
jgi:exodeoxyribonuclease III